MAIYDILCEVKDVREADTGICEFNGFLEDYLSIIETAEGKEDDYTILSQQSNVRMLYMEALMNTRRRLFLHWEIKRNM